jgi:hypothetical protein
MIKQARGFNKVTNLRNGSPKSVGVFGSMAFLDVGRQTVNSGTIIKHLMEVPVNVVLYFFCDFNDVSKKSSDKMIRTLAFQLYAKCAGARKVMDDWFQFREAAANI